MPPSIRIENVSKLYRLGEVGTGTLSHDLHRAWARLRGKPDPFAKVGQLNDRTVAAASASSSPSTSSLVPITSPAPRTSFLSRFSPLATRRSADASADYVWALKDINLEFEQGEIVGIIGRNGAGKSTLLKLLSRITEPTTGRIRTKGRIASLLEVGTGFHPELTGRENIYLNGSILGMRRHEITKHLEEIIEFSGCVKYIDTPVKRYSSGMMVRLGFAVAAHLDAEILIVDEVLAVGDAEFQKNCIGKISEVTTDGRTTLLVSHNLAVIRALTSRVILLEEGSIKSNSTTSNVLEQYMQGSSIQECRGISPLHMHRNRQAKMKNYLKQVELSDESGNARDSFLQTDAIKIGISYDATEEPASLAGAGVVIESADGIRVGSYNTYMSTKPPHHISKCGFISFEIPPKLLNPGSFWVSISLGTHQSILVDKVEHAIRFTIEPTDIYETGYLLSPEDGFLSLACRVANTK